MFKRCNKQKKSVLLGGKKQCTYKRIDIASYETINKAYAEQKQRELNKKGEKFGKVSGI